MPEYVVAIPKEVVDQLREAVRSALSGQATASSGVNVNAPFWGDENMQLSGVEALASLLYHQMVKQFISQYTKLTDNLAKKVCWDFSKIIFDGRNSLGPDVRNFFTTQSSWNEWTSTNNDVVLAIGEIYLEASKAIGKQLTNKWGRRR